MRTALGGHGTRAQGQNGYSKIPLKFKSSSPMALPTPGRCNQLARTNQRQPETNKIISSKGTHLETTTNQQTNEFKGTRYLNQQIKTKCKIESN